MKQKLTTQAKTKQLNKVAGKLETKKAEVNKDTAAKIAKASAATSKLTGAEKNVVAGKVKAACAKRMAKWEANGGKTRSADKGKGKAAADAAKQGSQAAAAKAKITAKLNTDINAEVEKRLPKALKLKVNGKVAQSLTTAVRKIKEKLTSASEAKLKRDTASKTSGKTGDVARRIAAA